VDCQLLERARTFVKDAPQAFSFQKKLLSGGERGASKVNWSPQDASCKAPRDRRKEPFEVTNDYLSKKTKDDYEKDMTCLRVF